MKKWIVIANRISTRIYSEKSFQHIITMKNPMGKERNRSLKYDQPGMSQAKFSGASSTHSLTGEKNPHEDAAVDFAREIRNYLKKESDQNNFDKLLIVAEPKMMGRIREHLPKRIMEHCEWVSKDLGHVSEAELPQSLGLKINT